MIKCDDIKTNAILQALTEQLHAALEMIVLMRGEEAILMEQLETAKKTIEELKPKEPPVLKEVG